MKPTPRKARRSRHRRRGGIGKSICGALAREGMCVVVGYNRSADGARELVDSLPGRGHAALSAPVTDSAALTGLASTIRARYGRCDVLVNCAGTTRSCRMAISRGSMTI